MSKPLVPWLGGKRKLAKHILPQFPEHTCYVEPFAGAAALYFLKEPSKYEILNDINGDITNLYRIVKHHLDELYKQLKWMISSRDTWDFLQATPVETLTDIQRAARFLYLQKSAFGAKVTGQTFGTSTTSRPRFNIYSLENDLTNAHHRLANTTVERMDWKKLIKKYDREHVLFYCDPPYWETHGYGTNFEFDEYRAMLELASSIKGKMIISINDHYDIRELFKDLPVSEVDYKYTVGGARNAKAVRELIYKNF